MEKSEPRLTFDEFKSRARKLGLRIPVNRDRELYDGFSQVEAFAQRVRKTLDPTHEPAHVFRVHKVEL